MDPITIAALISLIGTFLTSSTSAGNNAANIEEQEKLQEDAQDFTHSERVEQNQYEQQMHEFNLLNDPRLQMEGLTSAGVSSAAAAQAIAGSPSTGFTPTASNLASGIAQAPSRNESTNMFQGLSDMVNSYFQNQLAAAQTEETTTNVRYTEQLMRESESKIRKMANDMQVDNAMCELAIELQPYQIGLTQSQIQNNWRKLDEIDANITQIFARVENLNADSIRAYAQASLYRAQEANTEQSTTLLGQQVEYVGAQTELVEAQTAGQEIANMDAETVLALKNYRIEASRALGVDVDADITTQILEAMIAGRWDTVARLNEAVEFSQKNAIGDIWRGLNGMQFDKQYNRNFQIPGFNPSFQSTFQPVH